MESHLKDYTIAEGPDGLTTVLDELLEKTQNDAQFAQQEHYVLYQLGQQKSLLKIDASKVPFRFWYYDLMGRPMTSVVRETLTNFLWEKCGGKEKYLHEHDVEKR